MPRPDGYNYLAQAMPRLARRVPRVALGQFPTPLTSSDDGRLSLYIKRDDRSHPLYGGNKLRKLEYLFGRALRLGAQRVATFGAAGSNHALATAIHCRALGLEPLAFLGHQRASPQVVATLRAHGRLGTDIVYWGGPPEARRRIAVETLRTQRRPTWVIPAGGSSMAGALGYIGAAFELRAQIDAGLAPEPDRLYLPLGTMGTVAGLAVGMKLAGFATTLVAVRVVAPDFASETRLRRYCQRLERMLSRLQPGLGIAAKPPGIEVRHDQFGTGYAHSTAAADNALLRGRSELGLKLETTYSGKALAALYADRDAGRLDGQTVVFLNTY
ncbi:MAG: pyridoxal-phosphate dependent enzyme, partial [Pseudomonadota bacterium]